MMRYLRDALQHGGLLLLVSMTLVNGGNYAFNLILGRLLGPAAFADLTLVVTLVLVLTFFTATFQLTAARFSALYDAEDRPAARRGLQQFLGRVALACGLFLAIVVAGGAPAWQRFFNTASAWPFVILGVGLPLYLVQGVDRGILQGQLAFRRLAWSYQSEMWVRLLAGVALVALGLAVNGAVAALVLSFFATWIVVRRGPSPGERLSLTARRAVLAFAAPVLLVQLSQIAVNNSDVLLVKRLFTAAEAGQYAALALIGRIVFFATGAIVTALFPIVARRAGRGERHRHLLGLALAIVVVVSVPIIAAVALAPRQVITLFFGPAYLAAAPYLWVYAAATALYALTNVFVNYHLALGRSGGAWLTLLGGILQIALILGRHHDFGAVVLMQLAAMSVLLLAVLVWDGWLVRAARRAGPVPDREAALLHV